MIDASLGTIDDYLSGREEFSFDRRGYGKRSNFVGNVGLILNGERVNVTIQKIDEGKYTIWFFDQDGSKYNGRGNSPKKAFFDLLQKLKNVYNENYKKENFMKQKKENIIEIQEEIKIEQGEETIILEKGDKIKILNESSELPLYFNLRANYTKINRNDPNIADEINYTPIYDLLVIADERDANVYVDDNFKEVILEFDFFAVKFINSHNEYKVYLDSIHPMDGLRFFSNIDKVGTILAIQLNKLSDSLKKYEG